jgi:uncharacterized protein YcbX
MTAATVTGLWRHPVKGFTPEAVGDARLEEGGFFPFDRLYALEVGPSGYDPEAPRFISKMRFAVLARFAAVARIRTRYDAAAKRLHLAEETGSGFDFELTAQAGREALARHVETILARFDEDYDPARFPLKVLVAPGADFRFMDSSKGFVSLLNLNSLRDLGGRLSHDLDPLRLRCNIWMEGLDAFEDHAWVGRRLKVGAAGPELEVIKPIERCVATHVNPDTAERDVDVCAGLWGNYGHRDCGIYARILKGGTVSPGDEIRLA